MRKDFGKLFLKTAATGMLSLSLAVTPAATAFVSADEVSLFESYDEYGDVVTETEVNEDETYYFDEDETEKETEEEATPTSTPKPTTAVKVGTVKKVSVHIYKKLDKISVDWSEMKKVDGYEILYANNKKFNKAKTVKCKYFRKTIKGLKKGEKYFIKVRAYKLVKKEKIFGDYSDTVAVKLTTKSIKKDVMEKFSNKLKKAGAKYFKIVDINGDGISELIVGKSANDIGKIYMYDDNYSDLKEVHIYGTKYSVDFKNHTIISYEREEKDEQWDGGSTWKGDWYYKNVFTPSGNIKTYSLGYCETLGHGYSFTNKELTKSQFDAEVSKLNFNSNKAFLIKNTAANRKKYCK